MDTTDNFEFSEIITRKLVRDGLISRRITDDDLYFMGLLKRVWTDEWYVAQMCKRFRPEKRAVMLAFPDFNKIQRYILKSYLKLAPGVKLRVPVVVDRIHTYLGVTNYDKADIIRIRQIAYNIRRNSHKNVKTDQMIALALLEKISIFT
ncbi:MAG: hypothetical protein ACOYL3_25605 [Desulfuromonadaceae bacterium]|jgi:hypothetical protein